MPPSERPPAAPSFARQVLLITAKDLTLEWRSREIVYTMVLFSVLVVIIFSFAFAQEGMPPASLAGGILWVVVAFAGTLGLSRFFSREQQDDTHRALLMCAASPAAIYIGKLAGVMLFMVLTEAVVVPLLVLLFGLEVSSPALLLVLLLLGTLGFSAVGCLFAATLAGSRGRDVLLGVLLYPIVTPVIVAGTKGTAALMAGPEGAAGALIWLQLLAVFDLVFVVLSVWIFGPLTREE